jgi:hypothetical protein
MITSHLEVISLKDNNYLAFLNIQEAKANTPSHMQVKYRSLLLGRLSAQGPQVLILEYYLKNKVENAVERGNTINLGESKQKLYPYKLVKQKNREQ